MSKNCPVSKSWALRAPTGEQDLLLAEAPSLDTKLAFELLSALARHPDGHPPDWDELSAGAFEALLMALRQRVFGDLVRAEARCPSSTCRATIDVSFSTADLLESRQPSRPRGVKPARRPGWYSLSGATFRPVRAWDRAAAARVPDPERELIRRSVRPAGATRVLLDRVERAMVHLDPLVSREISGNCPMCAAPVRMYFDVQSFVLEELRQQAVFVFDDVHLLASRYRWTEERILAMPRSRRRRYAERILEERNGR
jgi:hypothetical protein